MYILNISTTSEKGGRVNNDFEKNLKTMNLYTQSLI